MSNLKEYFGEKFPHNLGIEIENLVEDNSSGNCGFEYRDKNNLIMSASIFINYDGIVTLSIYYNDDCLALLRMAVTQNIYKREEQLDIVKLNLWYNYNY